MQRHRRLVLTDRLIPFLAALVGLIALGGAVLVQVSAEARTQRLAAEIGSLRGAVEALSRAQAEAMERPADPAADREAIEEANGTVEALLALQERMDRLEEEWASPTQTAGTGPVLPGSPATAGAFAATDGTATGAIDPSWPTEDCIPLGTRFMSTIGDELAICESPVVVRVRAITDDNVMMDDIGLVTETAFKTIPGSNCQLTVFTADIEGFAEMRVSCL